MNLLIPTTTTTTTTAEVDGIWMAKGWKATRVNYQLSRGLHFSTTVPMQQPAERCHENLGKACVIIGRNDDVYLRTGMQWEWWMDFLNELPCNMFCPGAWKLLQECIRFLDKDLEATKCKNYKAVLFFQNGNHKRRQVYVCLAKHYNCYHIDLMFTLFSNISCSL